MLNHLSVLKFKSQTTDADIKDLEKDLDELPNSIVEIQMYEFGRNVSHTPNAHDFAVLALFANEDTFDRYLRHPEHVTVREKIERICESVITVNFYGSDAASLREKPLTSWVLGDDFSGI